MNRTEQNAFSRLFSEAYEKCFSKHLHTPLSENESRHLSNEVLEQSGLVIGWKSIKNYSFYVLHPDTAKQENPSVATLDTLARYVANAPRTDEAGRRKNEGHFGYWYNYLDAYVKEQEPQAGGKTQTLLFRISVGLGLVMLLAFLAFYFAKNTKKINDYSEDFNTVDSLLHKGWILKEETPSYWSKRNEKAGHLTLYTLDGDNYPDTAGRIGIRNLLLRETGRSCFSVEIQLSEFIPQGNWQQVGLLLMEDTTYTAGSVRFSLSFNDFFGGYHKPGEILLQVISANDGTKSKPEEVAHTVVFSVDASQAEIIRKNLKKAALRIEKRNNRYRFLFAAGENDIFAFKEIAVSELSIKPRYAGIFALKGFKAPTPVIPAHIDFFSLKSLDCGN